MGNKQNDMQTTDAKKLILSLLKPASARFMWRALFKRAFDILVSSLGLILLSPFLLPVAILLRRESSGPILFRGPRLGRGGKPFNILKFRTMYERPETYNGPRVTAKGDDRITPLGHWLRGTKLNELPQLWNVLIGDMSMVGPRPEDPEIAKTWPAEACIEILSIRPGITSPASVLYRDEENLLPAEETMDTYFREILPDKLRLDLLYVPEPYLPWRPGYPVLDSHGDTPALGAPADPGEQALCRSILQVCAAACFLVRARSCHIPWCSRHCRATLAPLWTY